MTFTNSVDPDEMQHYAAFHLGLYCLQKYSLAVSGIQRVKAAAGTIGAFEELAPLDLYKNQTF